MNRFWSKVVKIPGGCWLWSGGLNSSGYGSYFRDGRLRSAHRESWRASNGQIPKGLCCLHRCDVPSCVNPDHLFLGTHSDNMGDMVKKGRSVHRCGAENPNAKLAPGDVGEIRRLVAAGEIGVRKILMGRFGVSKAQISKIVAGKAWKE